MNLMFMQKWLGFMHNVDHMFFRLCVGPRIMVNKSTHLSTPFHFITPVA